MDADFGSSFNNKSVVIQSDWIIISCISKWNGLQGHKTGQRKKTQWTWTSERYKHTRQLNFTRQIQRMTIQDGTIQVNK